MELCHTCSSVTCFFFFLLKLSWHSCMITCMAAIHFPSLYSTSLPDCPSIHQSFSGPAVSSCACMLSHFSHVWLFVTPWTVACQALLSMGFSRQEYWNGLLIPSPGDLPDPGIKSTFFMSAYIGGGFFTARATWEAPLWAQSLLKLFVLLKLREWG